MMWHNDVEFWKPSFYKIILKLLFFKFTTESGVAVVNASEITVVMNVLKNNFKLFSIDTNKWKLWCLFLSIECQMNLMQFPLKYKFTSDVSILKWNIRYEKLNSYHMSHICN